MSGASFPDPADELVVLAGEYVLGTLPREEAVQLALEAENDPSVASAIAWWERHLAPLAGLPAPVTPPVSLWPRIEATAYGAPGVGGVAGGTSGRIVAGRLALWRAATGVGFLLAASVAGIALFGRSPPPVPVAVLMPMGATPAAFVVEARRDGGIRIMPMHPAAVPPGRDLELWSLADGATVPRPLGVLPVQGLLLAADRVPTGPVRILVSLEPKGGSPTGLPTGPVLYGAALPGPD